MNKTNIQPVDQFHRGLGESLEVHSMFSTIQGEGPFVGMPAIFLRLAGCNLQCPGCDTDYTSKRESLDVEVIAGRISAMAGGTNKLVVITGGEPLRQPIGKLVSLLHTLGFKIQLETNGTLLRGMQELCPWSKMTIVCSPKSPTINREMSFLADAFKYVVQAGKVDPSDGLPTSVLGSAKPPARPPVGSEAEIFVQPMDEGDPERNALNTQAAVESCIRHGYRLCLQVHKIVNLE